MTRAISRDSFNELKQYIGVHLQQGRVILDSDWNEGQDIMATLARRLGQDAFGDGVLGEGFEIQPVIPSPWKPGSQDLFELSYFQGHLPVSMRFPPTDPFDTFESIDGWALEGGTGKLRISRDQPYDGRGFLRLSDHTGEVTVVKTLSTPTDLSAFQYGHFRFRLNHDANVPSGAAKFFIEDTSGNRNLWPLTAPWAARERWFPGVALPLDLRFHLFDIDLLPAIVGQPYNSALITYPADSKDVSFSIMGIRPPGLDVVRSSLNATPSYGLVTGTPTQAGGFTFTVNATSEGITVAREFTLAVLDDPARTPLNAQLFDLSGTADRALDFWKMVHARPTIRGRAANLSSIKRYGFIVSPQGAGPAVWDFDALYFSNRSAVHTLARDNFVISGPAAPRTADNFLNTIQMRDLDERVSDFLTALSQNFGHTARAFVNGYACGQPSDMLYSDQRDPHDPPITAPPILPSTPSLRKDLVYLDITRQPVTYIEDPDLREIALGGPDTSTRMQIQQRVRVSIGGSLPTDGGVGRGTLATEGSYTDTSNRLYLVEIDTEGDIGRATIRWSDNNGSTLQRVIETIPSGSNKIKVEDASTFHSGDLILLREEFTEEEHRIASVTGNTITLQTPGGVAATFALEHRPRIQRWNALHTPVLNDPNDSTVSAPINLSFGVAVRIGGRALKKGDFWTFRTRHLAGDIPAGIEPSARIETLDFQPPKGVSHYYAPLALIVRDSTIQFSDRVQVIRDLRRQAGRIVQHQQPISFITPPVFSSAVASSDFLFLGSMTTQNALLFCWSGTAQSDPLTTTEGKLTIKIDLFDDRLTIASRDDGKIGNGATMDFIYNNKPTSLTLFSFIHRIPAPNVIALRITYITTRTHEAASLLSSTVDGTLTVIKFNNPMQDIATLPFDP